MHFAPLHKYFPFSSKTVYNFNSVRDCILYLYKHWYGPDLGRCNIHRSSFVLDIFVTAIFSNKLTTNSCDVIFGLKLATISKILILDSLLNGQNEHNEQLLRNSRKNIKYIEFSSLFLTKLTICITENQSRELYSQNSRKMKMFWRSCPHILE